jgi:hypothetical protein
VTMIDETVLSDALHELAEAIAIPEGARDRILAAARTSAPKVRPPKARRVVPRSRRVRVALVTGAVALVVGGVMLPLLLTGGGTPRSTESVGVSRDRLPARAATSNGLAIQGGDVPAASSPGEGSTSSAPGSTTIPPLPQGAVGQSAKIEASGSIDLTIGRGQLQSILTRLTNLAAIYSGFVASTNAQIGSGQPASGTIVLRVPETNFQQVLSQVQRVGHATSVTTTATDVTGQYVDLQARITALQASRQQYLTIMAQATSIGDVLAVQSQLDTIQSQIEQLQGQLNVLNNETTYGTLTVSLSETGQRTTHVARSTSGLAKAWHDGIEGFISGFEWLIRVAGPTLFILICLAVLVLLGRWAWRASRRRML